MSHLEYVDVSTPGGVAALMERAMRQRSVAQTAMNEQSSRSHMVFMLSIEGSNQGTSQRVQGGCGVGEGAGRVPATPPPPSPLRLPSRPPCLLPHGCQASSTS